MQKVIVIVVESSSEDRFAGAEKFPPQPGQYHIGPDGYVMICCPQCKVLSPIKAPVHTIDDNGAVTPSVVCPMRCGYHKYIVLDGYPGDSHAG